MTEDEWLDACADNPDDDMTRLAFADWLEERGDADRAEFIRLQVEFNLQKHKNYKWKKRANTLLHHNRSRWLGPLLELSRTEHWLFHRGLPEELRVRNERLTQETVARLAASAQLTRLRVLDLERCDLDDCAANAFAASPYLVRLVQLGFMYNRIGDAGAGALAASPHLVGLTSLCLWTNQIGDSGATALANSPYLTGLTYLELGRNQIGESGVRALLTSPYLVGLKTMWLSQNRISDAARNALSVEFGDRARL